MERLNYHKGKRALITGATSGIGAATARLFAQEGIHLIICGRREERLQALARELQATGVEVSTACFDVSQPDAVKQVLSPLVEQLPVDILINNAGNAHGLEPFHEANMADWEAMISINVMGVLYVSQVVVPTMVQRKSGQVINISSIAGREAYPKGAVYCASKAAVDKITEGMRMDLLPFGIKVGSIAPGMVETEFSLVRFKQDASKASAVYQNIEPLRAEDIAETALFMVSRPPHVNLADVLIFPTAQASATVSWRSPS